MVTLSVEISGSNDFGPCECCGAMSRTVWGNLHRGKSAEAAHFVRWTLGQVDRHGANFDLIVGTWGEGTTASDRCAVSLECQRTDWGPMFMVIDSAHRPVASSNLVGRALSRGEVIDTPLAQVAFELADAIWLQDTRIAELTA
jgi:hypothetical protein